MNQAFFKKKEVKEKTKYDPFSNVPDYVKDAMKRHEQLRLEGLKKEREIIYLESFCSYCGRKWRGEEYSCYGCGAPNPKKFRGI